MTWELLVHAPPTGLGWAQWVDRQKAEAWRAVCRSLQAQPPPGGSTAENLEVQFRATLDVWLAVGGWCLACDLPCEIFVPYARAVLVTSPEVWRPALLQALRRESPEYVEAQAETVVEVSRRLSLRNSFPGVDDRWLKSPVAPSPPQGLDYNRSGAVGEDRTIWGAWVWAEWYPGALAADHTGRVFGLTPVRDIYAAGLAAASFIAGRTTEEAIDACRNYAAAKNLRTARAIAPNALPSEVSALIVSTRSDDELLNTRVSPELADIAAVGGIAGAAIGGLGSPVAAVIVGIFAGLGAALQRAFGTAVGYNVDAFGRREPVLERTSISGSLAPRSAPSHAVPAPLGLLLRLPVAVEQSERPPVLPGGGEPRFSRAAKGSAAKMAGALALAWLLLSNSGRKG